MEENTTTIVETTTQEDGTITIPRNDLCAACGEKLGPRGPISGKRICPQEGCGFEN